MGVKALVELNLSRLYKYINAGATRIGTSSGYTLWRQYPDYHQVKIPKKGTDLELKIDSLAFGGMEYRELVI